MITPKEVRTVETQDLKVPKMSSHDAYVVIYLVVSDHLYSSIACLVHCGYLSSKVTRVIFSSVHNK